MRPIPRRRRPLSGPAAAVTAAASGGLSRRALLGTGVAAGAGLALAGIPERTALIREADGRWRVSGAGEVRLFKDRHPAGLEILTGV